jgi:hypothetical protein
MAARVAGHVAWRDIDGETFVIDLKSKRMYGLNPLGGQVWRTLAMGGDPSGFASEVTPGPVSDEYATAALEGFLAELEELGLIARDESTRPASNVEPRPDTGFVPPQVVWQEELRAFGFSCAFLEGQNPACDTIPVA